MVMRIKKLREAQGISQKALADDLGVLVSSISNWENEFSLPRTRQLPGLAKALNVSVSELYDPDYLASVS